MGAAVDSSGTVFVGDNGGDAVYAIIPEPATICVQHLPYGPDPAFAGDPNQPGITWCLGWSSWNGRSKPMLMGWGESSNGVASAVFDKAELQAAIDDTIAAYGDWEAQIRITQVEWIHTPIPEQFVPVVGSADVGSSTGYFGWQGAGQNGHPLLQDPKINSPHRGGYTGPLGTIPANPQWLDHVGTGHGMFYDAVTAGVPSGASALSIGPSWSQYLWTDIVDCWTIDIDAKDIVEHYVTHPDALLLFAGAVGDIGVQVFGAGQWGDAADIRVVFWPGPATLLSSEPPADGTLPKTQNNVILLTFSASISLPGGAALSVVPIAGGPDAGSQFDYSVEPDGVTLKAIEQDEVLTNLTWYRVTPTASFDVEPFILDVCTLRGDANGSARVTTADYTEVKAHMGEYTDARYDLNGSGRVTTADYIVAKDHMGNRCPPKP